MLPFNRKARINKTDSVAITKKRNAVALQGVVLFAEAEV